jgi:hypothetical protein
MEGDANARPSNGVDLIGSSLWQGTCDLQNPGLCLLVIR